jgi:polyadenylation factor subunit 2
MMSEQATTVTSQEFRNPRIIFDGKRIRKAVVRRPVDYNSTIIRYLEERYFRKDKRINLLLEPDDAFIINVRII